MTHLSYFTGDKYRERVCRLITDQAESTPLLAITTTIRNGIGGYAETTRSVGVSRADWLTLRLAILFAPSVYPTGRSISVAIATMCFMPYSASNPLQVSVGSAIRIYSDFLDRHEDRQYLTHWRNAVAQLWQYAASYSSTSRSNRPAINITLSRF